MSHLLTTKKTEALDAAVAEASRNQRSTRPQEEEQTTPQERLWTAAEQGRLEALREACASADLDARRPADGLAALHLACIRGSDGAVATLLRNGASVTAEDASGRTALHAAAASDRANCCFALQKWGGREFAIDAVEISTKLLFGPFTAFVFVEFANIHEPRVAPDRAGGGTGYNIKMSRGVDGVVCLDCVH